jgi:surfeit locus 1 family protein
VPAGRVSVVGRANVPPQRYLELGKDREQGPLWQNLDIGRIAAATRLPLLPFIIEQTDPVEPADNLVRDWPPPDFGVAQHLSYMVQWYSLAALAVILWLALNWRRRASDHDSPR